MSLDAPQLRLMVVPDWVNERVPGTLGGVVSAGPLGPYTSSSEIWPAGQPVLAVIRTRM